MQSIENHLPKLQKEAKADPSKRAAVEQLQKAEDFLAAGNPLYHTDFVIPPSLPLLTTKPIIYVFNVDEADLTNKAYQQELHEFVAPAPSLFINAKVESELAGLSAGDAKELLESYGIVESGLNQLARAAYDILGLQSYLTAGQKEVRAWTIKKGSTAPQAAGVIHSDFERGFIAAQVISFHDLVAAGSEATARNQGKLRTEGKTYVMQPDDVVEFRFNV
ncbi:MAG: redox-regulated ATPase YchF [Clostridia bacterium]|nr:redox-regulated ATPase YchF [Clostridia bacterium]